MGLYLELQMCIVCLFYLRVVNYNMMCIMPYNIRMDLQEVGCGYMDWAGPG